MNKIIEENFILIVVGAIVVAFLIKKISGMMNQSTSDPDGQKLTYTNEGRSGYVHYKSPAASFSMYWEFGGGDVVTSISIPSSQKWVSDTGIPLEKREEVLNFIGNQVVKDQTTNGRGFFKIAGNFLNIYN